LKKLQADTGDPAALGHGAEFRPPAVHARRGDELQRGCLLLRGGAGEEGAGVDPRVERRGLCVLGRARGYSTLLNTDLKREMDHLGRFMHMAVDYKKKIGFKGPFYIEPKPKEPTKHQYDSDAAACLNFLREYGLLEHFKLNLETNHATLAGHTMQHELEVAGAAGALGSIDANTGDLAARVGHRPVPDRPVPHQPDHALRAEARRASPRGGTNFDAKVRRESFMSPTTCSMPTSRAWTPFARGLKIAAAIRKDGRLSEFVKNRYRSWDSGIGAKIEAGKATFADCEKHALKLGEVGDLESGRQELLEAIYNEFL
jgi:xylose isomerase